MAKRIKKEDEVVVIAGAAKGRSGKVLEMVNPDRVVVEGVNKRFRHLKPSQTNPKGGRVEKEFPIHISNVMLKSRYDEKRAAKTS